MKKHFRQRLRQVLQEIPQEQAHLQSNGACQLLVEQPEYNEAEIIDLCKDELGSVKAPKAVAFWDELPRSAVGKVKKRDIRDHFWAGHERKI